MLVCCAIVVVGLAVLIAIGLLPAAASAVTYVASPMVIDQPGEYQLVTDILNGWRQLPSPAFPNYEAGAWGPTAADELLARDGRRWRRI